MRWPAVAALCGLVMLSCTRVNPSYAQQAEGGAGGTDSVGPSTVSSTSSGSTTESTPATTGTGPTPIDVGAQARCTSLSMLVPALEGIVPTDGALEDVPVLVDLSAFERPIDGDTLRFYLDETPLPHELERGGTIAWVRLPFLGSDFDVKFRGLMGPGCDVPASPFEAAEVWSHGYVAVFHFDSAAGDPAAVLDSVHGIPLVLTDGSTLTEDSGHLGAHLRKTSDAGLVAQDPRIDLSGPTNLTALGWVRLADGHADVLEWDDGLGFARHRELLANLPGYRLCAVRGENSANSSVAQVPFFNIAQDIAAVEHANLNGESALDAGPWTMLTGVYDGSQLRFFVDEDEPDPIDTNREPGDDPDDELRVGQWLHGGIDEIRIASEARSAAWVLVQYLSMTNDLLEYDDPVTL